MKSDSSWNFNIPGQDAEPNAPFCKQSLAGNNTRQGVPRLFRKKKSISEMVLSPGFGVEIGCGVGLGVGLVGGMGFSDSPWNLLQPVLGFGIGCGVGVGIGYGQGIGYGFGKEGVESALEKMDSDLDRKVVIKI